MARKDAKGANKKTTEDSTDNPMEKPDDVVEGKDDTPQQNGEVEIKTKKSRAKKTSSKKTEYIVDVGGGKDDTSQQNGETDKKIKKSRAITKKTSAKKTKIPIPGERKSARSPKPVTKEGDEATAFEVEKLVESRVLRGVTQFLVRWKGYSRGDDTWEDESSLNNCTELVNKFKAEHPASEKKAKKRQSTSKSPSRKPKKIAKKKEKEADYEVEEIVGVRMKGNKKEFKVRWKGFKPSDDTWEPEKNLSCQDLIKVYIEENKEEIENLETAENKEKKPTKKRAKSPAKSKKAKKTKSK